MAVQLNHHIVSARDKTESVSFLAEILGLPAPVPVGPFAAVQIGDTTLDFRDREDDIAAQHYAFLVSEAEFDAIFGRIRARGLTYWGRSRAAQGRRDERLGRRARRLFQRPERPPAGGHHPALRQRRRDGPQPAPAGRAAGG